MRVSQLLKSINITEYNGDDFEVSDIIYDSRKVIPNSVFVCLVGAETDGHNYVNMALEKGAKLIVSQKELDNCNHVIVENTRKALAELSREFFGNPCEKLTTIGITGTKGKTTTACMIKNILEKSGKKVGMIGTLGIAIGDQFTSADNTTPESYVVFKNLAKMVENGCNSLVMEVSSIGLREYRVYGINFDVAVFTNFSRDHIGGVEHSDMQEYFDCKAMLFKMCKNAVVNADDDKFEEIINISTANKNLSFGFTSNEDIYAVSDKLVTDGSFIGSEMEVKGLVDAKVRIAVPGKFNAYNALASISVAKILNIDTNHILEGLYDVKIKGRVEPVKMNGNFSLLLDYAHNAVSMENVLSTLREYQPTRLVCLFGAGGNRPKVRRYEMGEVSGNMADLSVITADNSRFEEVDDIIADIKIGMAKTTGEYIVIPDRKEAIRYCIDNAQDGDIIVLAGKGHEDYQEIKGVKYPFDERVVIQEILEENTRRT